MTYQMGILELLDDLYLVELDVEVLVDALQRAADLYVVFQLHRDLVVDERLEEAVFPENVSATDAVFVASLFVRPLSCRASARHHIHPSHWNIPRPLVCGRLSAFVKLRLANVL